MKDCNIVKRKCTKRIVLSIMTWTFPGFFVSLLRFSSSCYINKSFKCAKRENKKELHLLHTMFQILFAVLFSKNSYEERIQKLPVDLEQQQRLTEMHAVARSLLPTQTFSHVKTAFKVPKCKCCK